MTRLTDKHSKLLAEWNGQDVGMGFHFRALEQRTGLDRGEIRPLVRDLAAVGHLEFVRGCFTDDGTPYGSAYVLTNAGRAALKALEAQGGKE